MKKSDLKSVYSFDRASTVKEMIRLAKAGIALFPAHRPTSSTSCSCKMSKCQCIGKHPQTKHGHKDAVRDKKIFSGWIKNYEFNLAAATGERSGIIVVDADKKAGGIESLKTLEEQHGKFPPTWRSMTGGGGYHYIFRHPGYQVRNRVGLRPGLDIRGDGGYIITPPSVHRSGSRYNWDPENHPDDQEIADAPQWLLDELSETPKNYQESRPVSRVVTASEWMSLLREGLSEGERNSKIVSLTGHLIRKGIDPYVTLELIAAFNESRVDPSLDDDELFKCVHSVVKMEIQRRGIGLNG